MLDGGKSKVRKSVQALTVGGRNIEGNNRRGVTITSFMVGTEFMVTLCKEWRLTSYRE